MEEDLENPLLTSFDQRKKRHSWLFYVYFGIFFVFLFSMLICVVNMNPPKAPEFHVNSVFVDLSNATNGELKGSWNVTLSITNPTKEVDWVYEEPHSWIYYKQGFISSTRFAQFHSDGARSLGDMLMDTRFTVDRMLDLDGWVSDEIWEGFMHERAVRFDLLVEAKFEFLVGTKFWLEKKGVVMVECNDLMVEFPLNQTIGSLSNGGKRCQVRMYVRKGDVYI